MANAIGAANPSGPVDIACPTLRIAVATISFSKSRHCENDAVSVAIVSHCLVGFNPAACHNRLRSNSYTNGKFANAHCSTVKA